MYERLVLFLLVMDTVNALALFFTIRRVERIERILREK